MDSFLVESLTQQCLTYILMHFEKFPMEYLSSLPLHYRWAILYRLPIADVCQLENTEFVRNLDLFDYWRSIFSKEDGCIHPDYSHEYTREYFDEQWSDRASVEKSIAYGKVVANGSLIHAALQANNSFWMNSIASILYGIRKEDGSQHNGDCFVETVVKSSHKFPPRNLKYKGKNLVESAVHCFKGNLPTFFHISDIDESSCGHLRKYIPYLKNLRYLGLCIDSHNFGPPIQDIVLEIVRTATNLEVLSMKQSTPLSLDEFFSGLSKCSTFLSKMHLLRILGAYSHVNLDLVPLCLSFDTFKKLIDAYLATKVNHHQVIHFEDILIGWNIQQAFPDVDSSGTKIIELSSCELVVETNSVFCR